MMTDAGCGKERLDDNERLAALLKGCNPCREGWGTLFYIDPGIELESVRAYACPLDPIWQVNPPLSM